MRSLRVFGLNTGTPVCIIQRKDPRTLGRNTGTPVLVCRKRREPRTLGRNTGTPVLVFRERREPRTLGKNTGTPVLVFRKWREPRTLGRNTGMLALVLGEDVHLGAVNADKVLMLVRALFYIRPRSDFWELVAPSDGAARRRAAKLRVALFI
jgi:hypothetical protein